MQPFSEPGVSKSVGASAALEHDAKLMLRVREGDACSFELLLEKYRRPVIRYLYRMVEDQALAEELAQEVFLRVYRARNTYQPSAKFTAWLFRITTHLALNSLRDRRKARNHRSVDAPAGDGGALELADQRGNREQQMVAESRLQAVREAIAALPEKQRAAVLMHKYEELDYTQIAGVLGCSVSAVKSLLFRAYETLRGKLSHLALDRKERSPSDGEQAL